MSNLSTAAASALTAIANSADGGMVEEYEIRPNGARRVKRGNPLQQVDAVLKLNAIANRQSNGLFQLGKLRTDR